MRATLTFTRPSDVVPDEERPGMLRALAVKEDDTGDVHTCVMLDLGDGAVAEPGLEDAGFETIDLSGNAALQAALSTVRAVDRLDGASEATIRESLAGFRAPLRSGATLRIEQVVDDGMFHRRSGPDGLDVNPGGIDGANGHAGARYVHGDQDVYGTPLRQLLDGSAPDVFRHVTPDGRNDESTTLLLNLWIPLRATVQPLALMDRRTLDASRHQLRYGLPVDGFLERDEDATVNDIWSFLHDDAQQWYVRSDMGPDQGYVFDTLGTPHGAAVLAGEEALRPLFVALAACCDALDRGDVAAAQAIADGTVVEHSPGDASAAVVAIGEEMSSLLATGPVVGGEAAWVARARSAMDGAIRRSVEMRLVATLLPA